ncbi:hypothetical protein KU6B_49890 [Mameliella alba]|uniref:STAS/SEC14 domain-containing protein n=1 Tax=Mameliella alba TaxID=561184 RepID=UPI000890ED3B|nr:STAS/SEC14 domain-containing protein [Mameliella alba]OWV44120.1 STAS/SEC14 domain-containing protein [Mameliella alba]PTR36356.1 SpoIIAA-like protein [Mameliella alba]SDD94117.1 SpoIIAA-like [Mameliella alba]BBU58724.1 hypothetical protein KU6B_49890 [Mameliella alba]GGF79671.1 hypothetical protein GCM10011319_44870 [Mameliella alba]
MTIEYQEDDATKVVEFHITGHISHADYAPLVDRLQDFIDRNGTVRMIEVVEHFPTFDPSILIPGLKFDIRNIRYITHVAVVSDMGWISPVVKAAGALISTKIRTFGMAELEAARDWVRSADPEGDAAG